MPDANKQPPPVLSIVVPCFNEEDVLKETATRLTSKLEQMVSKGVISDRSKTVYVDDGSTDRTWELIQTLASGSPRNSGMKLARNQGHQHALLAGLENAKGDILISIDADLQDDIEVIDQMVEKFLCGADIVYAVRKKRTSDSFFKRFTAEGYYLLLQKMGVDIIFNHADYRLMSRRAIDCLKRYEEVNVFLRGIIPTIGFTTATVEFDRAERFAGDSKYPLKKMLALAIDGITSFSATPLRIIASIGLLVFFASTIISFWALWTRIFTDNAIPGWASSVLPMYVLGGLQLLSLGVIGEYVAKTYLETKRRPRYTVETSLDDP